MLFNPDNTFVAHFPHTPLWQPKRTPRSAVFSMEPPAMALIWLDRVLMTGKAQFLFMDGFIPRTVSEVYRANAIQIRPKLTA